MTQRTVSVLAGVLALVLGSCMTVAPVPTAPVARAAGVGPSAPAPGKASPAAPSSLLMTHAAGKGSLSPNAWVGGRLDLHFQVHVTSGPLVPQVELEPFDTPFTGQSNFTGSALTSAGQADVPVSGLVDGQQYHWQARVVDSSNNPSPWVPFAQDPSTPDFRVDLSPPSRPVISSSTDPNQNQWYNTRSVALHWTSTDSLSGIAGYTYVLERRAQVIPPGPTTPHATLTLSSLADGVWFAAVRSIDRAGNWSPTATFRLQLDRQEPRITWLSPARFTFNPYKGPTTVQFRTSKDANVVLGLYRVGSRTATGTYAFGHVSAGKTVSITWSGKDARGKPVPSGYYFFSATATDHAGNVGRWNLGGIVVDAHAPAKTPTGQMLFPGDGKRIIVSLARQTLYAYDGDRLALETVVTTGNPNLPTPPGSYTVMAKYSPFEFVSPWPPGSPYWYPPSWSTYAMLFRAGGYFLHDAPWRSAFGPGTNGPGQPGTNYGGTHGCVNIPPSPMLFLWNWTPVGTPVDVVP